MTTRISNRTKRLLKRLGALTLVFAIATALLCITIPFLKSAMLYWDAAQELNDARTWQAQEAANARIDEMCEKDETFNWMRVNSFTKIGTHVKRATLLVAILAFIAGIAGYIFTGFVIWRDAPYFFRNSKLASKINTCKKSKWNHFDYNPNNAKTK